MLQFIKSLDARVRATQASRGERGHGRAPDSADGGHVDADVDVEGAARELAEAHPSAILRWGLERWGASLGIAFSGAEDVVLVHIASELGLPFSVFCLDTGRLHPETYRFIDSVRKRYKIEIALMSPEAAPLQALVRKKGLFSFYEDGHEECCGIRKVEPLRRELATLRAWATGQRRDQSPATRGDIAVVENDATFAGRAEGPAPSSNSIPSPGGHPPKRGPTSGKRAFPTIRSTGAASFPSGASPVPAPRCRESMSARAAGGGKKARNGSADSTLAMGRRWGRERGRGVGNRSARV